MATKKKKKLTKSKKTAGRKAKPTKKQTKGAPLKSAKKATAPQKAAAKKKSSKNAISRKAPTGRSQSRRSSTLRETTSSRSGEMSGDLQGLSDVERADSESVDELVEEGNAFEAGVIAGVEDADEHGEREVHTHEVLEDDVPEEYLDKD